jgi:4'-phosphopantetheinyl transferase
LFGEGFTPQTLPGERDVHVWTARLDVTEDVLRRLDRVLSPDEQNRATRFRSGLHRRRFVAGRGVLRWLLAAYCGVNPGELRFAEEAAGKPFLLPVNSVHPPCFNLSHSDRLALIAITAATPVGADIEMVRDVTEAPQIAERWFSDREREAFLGAPLGEQAQVFTEIWARKEAYVKALGHGLQDDLNTFDVTPLGPRPTEIHLSRNGPRAPAGWVLYPIMRVAGFCAAVALPGSGWQMSCRHICIG